MVDDLLSSSHPYSHPKRKMINWIGFVSYARGGWE